MDHAAASRSMPLNLRRLRNPTAVVEGGRRLFTPGNVTWVRLTPKAEQKVSQQP